MSLPVIQHPTFDLIIPSTNQTIRFRPMITKEEKILLVAKQSGTQTDIVNAVKTIVSNCIVTAGVDVDKLAIFDVDYIFVKIQAVSVSNIAKTSYKDTEDEKVYDFDIDLEKVIVKFANPEVKQIVDGTNKITFGMKYPTAGLYSDNKFLVMVGQEMVTHLTIAVIDTVNDQPFADNTFEQQVEFIDSLPIPIYDQIQQYINNLPTIFYKIEFTNSKGTKREIVLSSLSDFFTL